jgi:hypothetical protein
MRGEYTRFTLSIYGEICEKVSGLKKCNFKLFFFRGQLKMMKNTSGLKKIFP